MDRFKTIPLIGLLGVVLAVGFFGGQVFSTKSSAEEPAQGFPIRGDGSSIFADVADQVRPAVVYIRTERALTAEDNRRYHAPFDFFRDFFPDDDSGRERRIPGGGSGFVFDAGGLILTNHHVIKDAEDIVVVVETADGEAEFPAEVVGSDARSDVAIVRIEAPAGLRTVPLGDSDALRVGDWVMAIGTPFGSLVGSATVGIVSAKGRSDLNIVGGEVDGYQNFIQTDASINFGNSGGPLLNTRGEAIGINTAINPSGQGIGFAIPINMVKGIMTQLIADGRVRYGFLGIQLRELDKTMAQGLDLDIEQGILVAQVLDDTPASKAGIRQKDVIVEYNGEPVRDDAKFRLMVGNTPIGTEIPLVVWRDGKRKKLSVTIGERPEEETVAAVPTEPRGEAWLGLRVDDAGSRNSQRRFNTERNQKGVVVVGVEEGSPADEAGLREGDIITEVYSQDISNLEEYMNVAKKLKEREDPIAFLVKRGRSTTYIPVKPDKR